MNKSTNLHRKHPEQNHTHKNQTNKTLKKKRKTHRENTHETTHLLVEGPMDPGEEEGRFEERAADQRQPSSIEWILNLGEENGVQVCHHISSRMGETPVWNRRPHSHSLGCPKRASNRTQTKAPDDRKQTRAVA